MLVCAVFFALLASACWFGSVPAEATGGLRFQKLPKGSIVPPSGPSCRPSVGTPPTPRCGRKPGSGHH
ncbi:hypothetical protein SAY87_005214 [Trapa incisa]|uniref:Secreted protein n=1 Tax=Trapa incisa TaxID=236973 RepID=A0AAN7Q5Y4_9MYRT|nr:hypothetical protein SAY87_005214 [Trapa incisa]